MAINAALIPSWTALTLYYTDKLAALAIALFGLLSSFIWLFVSGRAQGLQDFWYDRLKEIEEWFEWKLQTFDSLREMKFWVDKNYWRRRQMRVWQPILPVFFLFVWSFFIFLCNQSLFGQIVPSWVILIAVWSVIGAALSYSYNKDCTRREEENQDCLWMSSVGS